MWNEVLEMTKQRLRSNNRTCQDVEHDAKARALPQLEQAEVEDLIRELEKLTPDPGANPETVGRVLRLMEIDYRWRHNRLTSGKHKPGDPWK